MDDICKCGGSPASRRASHRASQAPRSRTRSRTDNSGTTVEAVARYRSGTRERRESTACASSRTSYAATRAHALFAQFCGVSCVRRRQRAHDHVDVRQCGEHIDPYDFAKPAFHAIALHGRVRIFRHDDPCPGVTQKGSDEPNLEMRGSESLPLQADSLERAVPRKPKGSREAATVRCLRTSTGV